LNLSDDSVIDEITSGSMFLLLQWGMLDRIVMGYAKIVPLW